MKVLGSNLPNKDSIKGYLHAIVIGATIYHENYLHKTPYYDRNYSD